MHDEINQSKAIVERSAALLKYDFDKVLSLIAPEGGEPREQCRALLSKVRQICEELTSGGVDTAHLISGEHGPEVLKGIEEIRNGLGRANGEIKHNPNATDQAIDIRRTIQAGYHRMFLPVGVALALTTRQRLTPERYTKPLRRANEEATAIVDALRRAQETVESLTQQLVDPLAFKGQAEYFSAAVSRHRRAAAWWLAAVVALTVVTAGLLGLWVWELMHHDPTSPGAAIAQAIGRIAVISFASSLVVWAARNHRSHRHNQTVNEHRDNALRTFTVLSERGTGDETARATLLVHAAQAMFGAQHSGYGDQEPTPTLPPVLEVIKAQRG